MDKKIYDLIIVGAGPAGITAGIYAARKRMDCLILTVDIGGQAMWSGDVENYTGYRFITGPDLAARFEEHIKKYKVEVKEAEPVKELSRKGKVIEAVTDMAVYYARTAIIASGKRSKELGVPGEPEFRNKGLTYCATCDAPLFEGKKVAVVGGGNSALDAVIQLRKIASHISLIDINPELGGDVIMREKVTSADNVTVYHDSRVISVGGDKFVNRINVSTDGKEVSLDVEGVFVEIGLEPNSEFAKDVEKNGRGEIIINCQTETSEEGVYAAGDVTNVAHKQIIIAAGEGSKAALGAFRYLSRQG